MPGRSLRIAVVAACPFPIGRGTPVRILRLTEALAARGHQIEVFTYHLGEALTDPPFKVHRIAPWRAYAYTGPGPTLGKIFGLDPRLARKLARSLTGARFDLVYAHHYEALLIALAVRPRGLPVVYDAHTLLRSELPLYKLGLPPALMGAIGGMLDRFLPRQADHVVSVSQEIVRLLGSDAGIPAERLTLAPNGLEPELFEVARSMSTEADGERVVFAGNLASYQGIDDLLLAVSLAARRRPRLRLQILSEDDFAPYQARAAAFGIADRLDVVRTRFAELPAQLARAGVAVNPRSVADGVPQKLLNYMAAGLPIVSFDGAAVDLRNEETGIVVPSGDVAAMADALCRCLSDPDYATRLGAEARRVARLRYSWPASARRVEEACLAVVARCATASARPRELPACPP